MSFLSDENIQFFMSLFCGRMDVFARRWEKNGKSGWSPAYNFNWQEFMAFKAQGGTMKDFPNKKAIPLSSPVVRSHLLGENTIGIYPLLLDNTSYFIVADFDKENWQKDLNSFYTICLSFEIPVYIERSRSGNGGHAWIFFEDKYPAYKSRKITLELIRKALNMSEFEKEVSFDRLFPNQDYLTNQNFGNLICLPFQGKSIISGNTMFLNPQTFEVIQDQWEFIKQIKRVDINRLDCLYNQFVEKGDVESSQDSGDVVIRLSSRLIIEKSKFNPRLIKFLRDNLNFYNNEFVVKKNLGISTYKVEKYFRLIEETNDSIFLPRGFLNPLAEFLREEKISYKIVDERDLKEKVQFNSTINLYDYQLDAFTQIGEKDSGVIVAPPGSGKTVLGLELIARKTQPALILVHRKQLLDQWVERIQSFLGIPKNQIGQISGRKKKIGEQITVAMMQSLARSTNRQELSNAFGMIIVDECHHISAKTFRELIVNFNPYYLYGLTATPKRKYNDEKLIFYYIGDIIVKMKPISKEVGSDNLFAKSKDKKENSLEIKIRETNLSAPFKSRIDEFELISKILIFDSARNKQIIDDVLYEVKNSKRILILTERKEHVEVLNLYLKSRAETITLTGDDSVSKRKLKFAQIELGHFQVLISTGQFFGEGVDLNCFNCLFLVYPFSFEGKLIQYIGRIQRGKESKIIYDYLDKEIPYFVKLYKNRQKYYRKLQVLN